MAKIARRSIVAILISLALLFFAGPLGVPHAVRTIAQGIIIQEVAEILAPDVPDANDFIVIN